MTADERRQWLQRLVGDWTFESEMSPTPDAPAGKYRGTERVRSLGDAAVVCETTWEIPVGGTHITTMTLGYDTAKERFVGTVAGDAMNHTWMYDGEMDPGGTRLLLETEGPSYEDQGVFTKYVDTSELLGDDERVLRSTFLGRDGAWHQFMVSRYRRA